MRRRSRMKTLKILRLFAEGRIVVFIVFLLFTAILAEPGYLDFDNLPETNFTCAGKVIGGYYADLETSCQMFHVCTIGQLDEPMDIKFLCLNGTVFDQETRVCERVDEVDCTRSERFYYLNLELYGNPMVPIPEDNDDDNSDSDDSHAESSSTTAAPSTTTSTTTTTTTRRPTTSTPKPTTTTSTYRSSPTRTHQPPKKQSSAIVSSSTFKPKSPHYFTTAKPFEEEEEEEEQEEQDHHHSNHQQRPVDPSGGGDDADYAYEETDYSVTDGKDLGSYQDGDTFGNSNGADGLAEHVFSPQQFIFNQNSNNNKGSLGSSQSKPAISFQQQQFQNGGSLTVTNSHVTVTTHTNGKHDNPPGNHKNHNHNKQFSSRPNKDSALVTAGPSTAEEDEEIIRGGYSTTRKPHYAYGSPPLPPTTPKRVPLLPTSSASQQTVPAGHPGLPNLPNFQITAHGFRLPSTAQTDLIQAAQEKHAQELQTHRQQILDQLKQQQDLSPQEQHLREQEKHQHRLEQLQQAEIAKQLREQEAIRQEQELQRREQERKNQQHEQHQQQELEHQLNLQRHELQSSSNTFEGYRRHTPQVSLRLPIEHNPNQPQFLALASADADFPQLDHKDTKRSDPHAHGSTKPPTTQSPSKYPPNEYRETISSSSSSRRSPSNDHHNDNDKSETSHHKTVVVAASTIEPRVTTTTSSSSRTHSQHNHQHHNHHQTHQQQHSPRHNYDRVLLTPQDQYLSTLPKVIITASASVSDASGKKLSNYSVGNVIGPNIKSPPPNYDEYKEEDVSTDPFFLDVPKIQPRHVRHSTAGTTAETSSSSSSPLTSTLGRSAHRKQR